MTLPSHIEGFTIDTLVGHGGQGDVYRARNADGETRAIKIFHHSSDNDPVADKRFDRELAVAQEIDHPNVVRCYGGGRVQGRPYFIFEFIQGRTLAELLEHNERLNESRIGMLFKEVCRGLSAIHAHDIVHRDIKPSNILLAADGRVLVSDLGLARPQATAANLTASGYMVGTPRYMSPEQARSDKVDARADLYALGVCLFRALSGRLPFYRGSALHIIRQHLRATPPDLGTLCPHLHPNFVRLVHHLLEKDAEKRPPDALAVAAQLEMLSHDFEDVVHGTTVRAVNDASAQAPTVHVPMVTMTLADNTGHTPLTILDREPARAWKLGITAQPHTTVAVFLGHHFVVGRNSRDHGVDSCWRLLSSHAHAEENRRISGSHLRFVWEGHECVLVDLASTGGTLLNGQSLPSEHRVLLADGDVLELGGAMTVHVRRPAGFGRCVYFIRPQQQGESIDIFAPDGLRLAWDSDGLLQCDSVTQAGELSCNELGLTWQADWQIEPQVVPTPGIITGPDPLWTINDLHAGDQK